MGQRGVTGDIENRGGGAARLGHDPLSMAEHLSAYSAFDNGGYRISPHPVLKGVDSDGTVLEAFAPNANRGQVISSDLGYVMTYLLRGPVKLYLGDPCARPVPRQSRTTSASPWT